MITIYDWFGYALPITERYQLIKKAEFDGVLGVKGLVGPMIIATAHNLRGKRGLL